MDSFDALGRQVFWSVICLIYTPLITLAAYSVFSLFRELTAAQKLLRYGIVFFSAFGLTLLLLRFVSGNIWILLLALSAVTTVVVLAKLFQNHRNKNDEPG